MIINDIFKIVNVSYPNRHRYDIIAVKIENEINKQEQEY